MHLSGEEERWWKTLCPLCQKSKIRGKLSDSQEEIWKFDPVGKFLCQVGSRDENTFSPAKRKLRREKIRANSFLHKSCGDKHLGLVPNNCTSERKEKKVLKMIQIL